MGKITFDTTHSAKLPRDQRAAVALEHIAQYLDRIEGHLKKVAKAAEVKAPEPPANGHRMDRRTLGS